MNVVILDGGRGKTTMMLNWLRHHPGRVLVVVHEEEAVRLRHLYRRLTGTYADHRILAFRTGNLREQMMGRINVTIGIDNLEMLLVEIFRHPVEIVTMRP